MLTLPAHSGRRPAANLTVMTEATVDSLSLSQDPDRIRATGVKLLHKASVSRFRLLRRSCWPPEPSLRPSFCNYRVLVRKMNCSHIVSPLGATLMALVKTCRNLFAPFIR